MEPAGVTLPVHAMDKTMAMSSTWEITMHSRTILRLVTTFQNAAFMALSCVVGWGFHRWDGPGVKAPPAGEAFGVRRPLARSQ